MNQLARLMSLLISEIKINSLSSQLLEFERGNVKDSQA